MRIFNNIPSNDGEKTIHDAIVAILKRAQEQRLSSGKWSLAEIQLDQSDLMWLSDWASNLREETVQWWLEEEPWRSIRVGSQECSRSAALGTLLLLFAAETARREAREGLLWVTFQEGCFPQSTLRILYMNGQPTRSHKDALEAAARWLNLRHVFGIEGLQNWFDTVYLQFGFTHRGFLRRLPEWLVGQGRTQAVQHLQNGQMRSASFCQLWDALYNFRRNNITEEQLKTILVKNPWVLPEWLGELVDQAKARIELGYGGETSLAETNDALESFLDEPILRWDPPNYPQFVCHISNIAKFDLSDAVYSIMINGRLYAQLRRDSHGMYTFHPSEEIILPIAPRVIATLASFTGQIVASVTLQLWDNNDEITVWKATSGRRIDAWKDLMRPEVAFFLITAPDLTLSPEPSQWFVLDTQGTRLSLIGQGWSSLTSVQLEGQDIWQPNIARRSSQEGEPRWARSVDVSLSDISEKMIFGGLIQLWIHHPKGTVVSFIRLGARAIGFTEKDTEYAVTETLSLSPDMLVHGSHLAEIRLTLGIRKATAFARISRSLNLEVVGAAILSERGWTVLQPDMTITVEQAKTLPVQIFRSHIKQWALLEGDIWIGRPRPLPHPIGSLAGLGASLKLRLGPYNALEEDYSLVREVVNSGIIAHASFTQSKLTLCLERPIEPDEKHRLIIWNEDGTLYSCGQGDAAFEVQDGSWSLPVPHSITQPFVVALAYNGLRLGAWWHAEWSRVLLPDQKPDPKSASAMLRWFQLPLLSDRWFSQIQQFIYRYPSSVLSSWLLDNPLPLDLHWTATDDHWLSAVRVLFRDWQPSDRASQRVVSKLGGKSESPEELLLKTAWRLLGVDPLIMGKVIQTYVRHAYLPQSDLVTTRKCLRTLLFSFAKSVYGNDADFQRKKNMLVEDISNTMGGIDTNFIRRGLLEPALQVLGGKLLTPLAENNLALALNIEPFRRLLGIRILETIEQTLVSRR